MAFFQSCELQADGNYSMGAATGLEILTGWAINPISGKPSAPSEVLTTAIISLGTGLLLGARFDSKVTALGQKTGFTRSILGEAASNQYA